MRGLRSFSFGHFKSLVDKIVDQCNQKHYHLPVDCPLPEVADIAASLQRAIVEYIGASIQYQVKLLECVPSLITRDIDYLLDYNPRELMRQEINFLDHEPLHLQLVVSGGVACNNYITDKLREYCMNMETIYDDTIIDVIVPTPRNLCTDNGVMIGWNGVLKLSSNLKKEDILLSSKEEIMSLKPVHDACLGRDLGEWADMLTTLNIKPYRIL